MIKMFDWLFFDYSENTIRQERERVQRQMRERVFELHMKITKAMRESADQDYKRYLDSKSAPGSSSGCK